MDNNECILEFPWDKERKNIENIKFPRDIWKVITDTFNATFKYIPHFTPEKLYNTFLENDNTIIEWKYCFSNYAFHFWERLFNSRFDYSIEWEENLEKLTQLNRDKIWSIIISPHDSSLFESVLYWLALYHSNIELFENTYSVPRLWLMTSKLSAYAILMVNNIITLSAKDSHKYSEYKRFIAIKSIKSILEKSSSGHNIHMFPEWTKRFETDRWMNPIVDGFVKMLHKKIDGKSLKIMTSHITDLTAWKATDLLKKHTPKIHFSEPVDIEAIFENNKDTLPADFDIRYKKANILQWIFEVQKELKKVKNKNWVSYMSELIDKIDQDEENIDNCYKSVLEHQGVNRLPKHILSWFSGSNYVPNNDVLKKSWQVWRYLATKLPEKDKWIYKLNSGIEINSFEK